MLSFHILADVLNGGDLCDSDINFDSTSTAWLERSLSCHGNIPQVDSIVNCKWAEIE